LLQARETLLLVSEHSKRSVFLPNDPFLPNPAKRVLTKKPVFSLSIAHVTTRVLRFPSIPSLSPAIPLSVAVLTASLALDDWETKFLLLFLN